MIQNQYPCLTTCAVFVKDEILALNPPVSPQVRVFSGGVWDFSLSCAHTGLCICSYVLADIRAGMSVKLTLATRLFSPREMATHTSAYVLVDDKINCAEPLYSLTLPLVFHSKMYTD